MDKLIDRISSIGYETDSLNKNEDFKFSIYDKSDTLLVNVYSSAYTVQESISEELKVVLDEYFN